MKCNAVLRRGCLPILVVVCALNAPNSASVVRACLNEYKPTTPEETRRFQQLAQHKETIHGADEYVSLLTRGAGEHVVTDEGLKNLEETATNGDFRDRTNYAVALARRGRAEQAVELLLKVEAEQPGEYIVAANLGTAYELIGNNSEALRWIRTGVDRNADAHDGTEWLHVKILEAKLKTAADPAWLAANSVLGLEFGSDAQPVRPTGHVTDQLGLRKTIENVQAALEYQLHERMGLVAAPDAIVADLLVDLGNLLALGNSPHKAERVFGLAVEYDPTRGELALKRHAYLERLGLHQIGPPPLRLGLVVEVVLGVIVLAALIGRILYNRPLRFPLF